MPKKIPLRQQTFRYASLAVGLLIGLALVFFFQRATGRSIELPPGVIVFVIIFVIVVAVGSIALGQLIGRTVVGDRFEVAIRTPGEKWRHGRLTVSPGHLSFQQYRWQLRIPRGAPLEWDIVSLGEDTGRRPSLKQVFSINPQLRIVDLVTQHGTEELAILPAQLDELRERLNAEPAAAVE